MKKLFLFMIISMVFCNAGLTQEKKLDKDLVDRLIKSMEEEQNTKTVKEIRKCEKIMIGEPGFSLKKIKCKRYIKKLCKISRNENNKLNRWEKMYLSRICYDYKY